MTPRIFALREMAHRPVYAGLFAVSVGFGASVLMALAGFGAAVEEAVTGQARELGTADLWVSGSEPLLNELENWAAERWPGVSSARSVETISMALVPGTGRAGQVSLHAVRRYPLYGKIRTGSGRTLGDVLEPGSVVASPKMLAELGVSTGAAVRLGALDLKVADTIALRTDMMGSFFELAPTVFMTPEDLAASGLLAPGSRARRTLYLNLPEGENLRTAAAEMKARAGAEVGEVSTWQSDRPGVLTFIKNTLLFLSFLALLSLTLGGIGVASALSAALAASKRSLGMVFALGAPRAYVMKAWLWWIGILSAAGIFLSLWVGRALMALLTAAFADLLPASFAPSFPWRALGGAAAAGFAASLLFAALPLMRIMDIPPNAVLANAEAGARRRSGRFVMAALAAFGVFYLIILSQAGRPLLAGQYLGGLAAVLAGAWILVKVLMTVLRRTLGKSRRLAPRLAARALSRPGNLNDAAVVSMAVSLSVILALFLLHKNLAAKFVESFPEDMPNVFFINIQTSQAEEFKKVLGRDLRLFPLVRGRVTDVNGVPVRELEAKARRQRGPGDRLTREFGFTFGEDLLPTDRVVSGGGLWRDDLAEPQVSVFDEYRDRFGIRPGDRIAVNVLGRKVTAVVSSLRSIDTSRREPFFYFYFRPGVLDQAPHTLMGGVRVEPDRVAELESRLAAALPNVTTIDLSEVAALTGRIMARLARIVGTLGLFGVISGLLLLVSGLWATLASRARESVLYRTLGASEGQLRAVALLEYAFIGFGAALTAWLVGSAAAWGAMRFAFKTGFDPYALSSTGLLAGAALAAAAISWLATRGAFRARPMEVLRNE